MANLIGNYRTTFECTRRVRYARNKAGGHQHIDRSLSELIFAVHGFYSSGMSFWARQRIPKLHKVRQLTDVAFTSNTRQVLSRVVLFADECGGASSKVCSSRNQRQNDAIPRGGGLVLDLRADSPLVGSSSGKRTPTRTTYSQASQVAFKLGTRTSAILRQRQPLGSRKPRHPQPKSWRTIEGSILSLPLISQPFSISPCLTRASMSRVRPEALPVQLLLPSATQGSSSDLTRLCLGSVLTRV
jgi:hypothetical protein